MIAARLHLLLPAWRATAWEFERAGHWLTMPPCSATPLAAISAQNPDGRPLGAGANRDRDAALCRQLRLLGIPHRRCRGRLDGWCEYGFLLPDEPARTRRLLREWGQLAGLRWDSGGLSLVWRWDGLQSL